MLLLAKAKATGSEQNFKGEPLKQADLQDDLKPKKTQKTSARRGKKLGGAAIRGPGFGRDFRDFFRNSGDVF